VSSLPEKNIQPQDSFILFRFSINFSFIIFSRLLIAIDLGKDWSGIIFLRSANSNWRLQGRNILEWLSIFCSKSIKKNFKIYRLRKKKVRLNKICSGSEFLSILVEFRSKSLEKNDPAKLIQFVSLRFGPSRKWSKNLRARFALNSNNDAFRS